MIATTLSFANLHHHGELFANFFRARQRVFIHRLGWSLPETMGMEFDQYDSPTSRWIAVHDGATVLAGMRLTPSCNQLGVYSYMLRDAQRGLLDSLPRGLLDCPAPVAPDLWEVSRWFVCEDVPLSRRIAAHRCLADGLLEASAELGITDGICIFAANWQGWSRRSGLHMKAVGPVLRIDGIPHQSVMIDLAASRAQWAQAA